MTLKLGMQHRMLKYYQDCSNYDHDVFDGKVNLVPYAFVWQKDKIIDLSETVAVYDIKVGKCS